MSLQDLSIRQRIWMLTAGCLLGLIVIAGLAINKAQQQFVELKREQYQNLTTVALKNIDYFYQAFRQGQMSEIEAKRRARESLVHLALNDRIYFYLVHTDEMLLAHPFVTSIYPTDTAAEYEASLRSNRQGKVTAAERLGLSEPLIDTMTIIRETHPTTFTGFVDYYMYLHPEDNTAIVARMNATNLPDIAEPKTAYAAHFEPWSWVVISGVYREDETTSFLNWLFSLAAITASVILVLGVLAWRIAASVTRPLAHTVQLMNDISQGSGDLSKRLDIRGRNELGAFARGFNVFAEKIAEIVQRVMATNQNVIRHADELDNNMAGSVQRSDAQLAETEMLASATNELSYSLNSVSEHARNTASAARAAQQTSDHTREAMGNNIRSIRKLAEGLARTQQEVQSMQSFSNQVSSVLDVIVSIAEQTNLLALNAAIEAARAGEQGRGFAVVADEVRTLAQRTQNSTKEIHEIVTNLQAGTGRVVKAMDQGLMDSEMCVATADESSLELQRIVQYVNQISTMNAEIATAVEQQSGTTQEIARSSHKIAESSKDNLADIEKNRRAIQQMNQQLRDMEAQVRQFKA